MLSTLVFALSLARSLARSLPAHCKQDDVRAVPYWVDDPSLKASIEESGGGALLLEDGDRLDANKAYGQLLPYGEIAQARRATVQVTVTDHD